jgi:hypothetical protein
VEELRLISSMLGSLPLALLWKNLDGRMHPLSWLPLSCKFKNVLVEWFFVMLWE